jgi:hypothetical protein
MTLDVAGRSSTVDRGKSPQSAIGFDSAPALVRPGVHFDALFPVVETRRKSIL